MSGKAKVSVTTGKLLGLDAAEGETGVGRQCGEDSYMLTYASVLPSHPSITTKNANNERRMLIETYAKC